MATSTVERLATAARAITRDMGHHFLGTEHFFLAALQEEPALERLFVRQGFGRDRMTELILEISERNEGEPLWHGCPSSPRLKRCIREAEREANGGDPEAWHVVAAILAEGKGIPARILRAQGLSLSALRQEVLHTAPAGGTGAGGGSAGSPAGFASGPAGREVISGAGRGMEGRAGMVGMAGMAGDDDARPPGYDGGGPSRGALAGGALGGGAGAGGEIGSKASRPGEAKGQDAKAQDAKRADDKKSAIAKYAQNLTQMAREGKLPPVIGRQEEIRRCLQILTRKGKNNPVLIGEAGVGKTSVAVGLAQRIAAGNVPELMADREIWELSLTRLVAGAAYRGEFQERLQKIMDEMVERPNVILFVDELHQLMGAGDSKGGMDAGNILKPALARGDFPLIGATTTDEYRKTIETDPALERRFQPVLVPEPSEKECLAILEGLRERYEKHHGVTISDKALLGAVKLSTRFLPDRSLPDKAIDLIDEAASLVKLRACSGSMTPENVPGLDVREEDVAEVVSKWSGVPVTRLTQEDTERLLHIEKFLMERVIGQDHAVKVMAQTIRVMRVGLGNPNRPAGVFFCAGPTGVGKTELARALAEFLFGSEKDMVRIDMSEYMEKHAINRLIGSPPGYVGHEEEGQLTKAVRTRPYSVVLLDEVEKAHNDVWDLFLQVFDDGRLTDSKGRTVNFTNTIIILTSNVGARTDGAITDPTDPDYVESVHEALRKRFRPEFLNRIDEIVMFNALDRKGLHRILDLQIQDVVKRVRETRSVLLAVEPDARALLLEKGYSPAYGARPMRRAVQSLLVKPLAEEMLRSAYAPGDVVVARVQGDGIVFRKADLSSLDEADDQPGYPDEAAPSQGSPRSSEGLAAGRTSLPLRTPSDADAPPPSSQPRATAPPRPGLRLELGRKDERGYTEAPASRPYAPPSPAGVASPSPEPAAPGYGGGRQVVDVPVAPPHLRASLADNGAAPPRQAPPSPSPGSPAPGERPFWEDMDDF